MALDLAHDGGRCVCGELKAAARIKTVDRLEQAKITHLDKVVERLAAVLKLVCKEADEVHVGHHELFACLDIALLFIASEELVGLFLVPRRLSRLCRALGICHYTSALSISTRVAGSSRFS